MGARLQEVGAHEGGQRRARQHIGRADARIVGPGDEDEVSVLGEGGRLLQQRREGLEVRRERCAMGGGRAVGGGEAN